MGVRGGEGVVGVGEGVRWVVVVRMGYERGGCISISLVIQYSFPPIHSQPSSTAPTWPSSARTTPRAAFGSPRSAPACVCCGTSTPI